MKGKKGQVSFVMGAIVTIVVAGILLGFFKAPLEESRLSTLAATSTDDVLLRFILYGLWPIIYFFYIILSIFMLYFAIRVAQGGI